MAFLLLAELTHCLVHSYIQKRSHLIEAHLSFMKQTVENKQ